VVTIKRDAAIGDILMVTPIVQALRYKYGEVFLRVTPPLHAKIHALLDSPALRVTQEIKGEVIDLNGAYELRPHLHPVEAYCEVAEIRVEDTTRAFCRAEWSPGRGKFDVVIHPTVSWTNRTLPRAFWEKLVAMLKHEGLSVACIAQNAGEVVAGCDKNFINLPLSEVAGLIGYSHSVFVGGDSAPLHIAATTSTPIVGLFTIARAALRRPWGRGWAEQTFVGIEPALDCVGCLHRAPKPCAFWDCDFQNERKHACLRGFSVPEIVSKVLAFL
jgi:ADP-heptose:LPS heptosyltransferase